jgi:ribosomal-protein-alanine N-acetyltransferase
MNSISVRLLRVEDTDAVLNFEQVNRAWFEQWVPPRPDGYFARETLMEINADLVNEAKSGTAYMHLILDSSDQIIGRINLSNIQRENLVAADIGYRIAQMETGRGVASQAVKLIEGMARNEYGFGTLYGSCLATNPASCTVLVNRGFTKDSETKITWKGARVAMLRYRKSLT